MIMRRNSVSVYVYDERYESSDDHSYRPDLPENTSVAGHCGFYFVAVAVAVLEESDVFYH